MPDTPPPFATDEHTAQLWREYCRLGDRIDELKEKQGTIADTLRERCSSGGVYAYGDDAVGKVQPTRSFDVAAAVKLVPVSRIAECLKPTELDGAKIKRLLTPEQVEACMVESGKPKLLRP